jgi:uncharacterized protein
MGQTSEKKGITIITGGGSGLGAALAREAMSRDQHVIILGRDENRLVKMAHKLSTEEVHGKVTAIPCDVSNQADIDALCDIISEDSYTIDYLFNNAGTGYFKKVTENRSPDVEKIIGSNFTGMILLTSAILRLTPADSPLTIVNVMSTSALLGRGNQTVYCAAKWGARGFTEALRDELKGTKQRVIAVYPGGMKTSFYDDDPRDISGFMDPADVASQIAQTVFNKRKIVVSDITIVRP